VSQHQGWPLRRLELQDLGALRQAITIQSLTLPFMTGREGHEVRVGTQRDEAEVHAMSLSAEARVLVRSLGKETSCKRH